MDAAAVVRDAAAIDAPRGRAPGAGRCPSPGTFHAPPALRNFLPYGRELLDEGLEAAALVAFERASQASPSASTLYRLGTLLAKTGDAARARAAFECGARAAARRWPRRTTTWAPCWRRAATSTAAIERFRQALAATPEYPDALNNLGYALLLSGREQEARRALREARSPCSPTSRKRSTTSGCCSAAAAISTAPSGISATRWRGAPIIGDAANNLALVLVARGQPDEAVALLEDSW